MVKDSLAVEIQLEQRPEGSEKQSIAVWISGVRVFPQKEQNIEGEWEQASCSEHSKEGRGVGASQVRTE